MSEIAREELAPRAAAAEAAGEFPRELFTVLGQAGVLGLPYPEEYGGGGQPYEVYLQALEEIAQAWMSVGVGVSVHIMTCYALARYGTERQRAEFLPGMIAGDQLGAYALSEPQAGSDIAGITTRAKTADEGWALAGTKAWVTHGSQADFYTTFARTSEHRTRGLSCFLVPGDAPGLTLGRRRPRWDSAARRRPRCTSTPCRWPRTGGSAPKAQGMKIALSALDSGRLGHRRLRDRTGAGRARLRRRLRGRAGAVREVDRGIPGNPVPVGRDGRIRRLGTGGASLMAARKRDAGRPFTRDAAVAKMTCTDTAMRVTTDAVQVLGGYGYTRDFPAERYLREAKVTQIFEGTNQIQRLVIARQLLRGPQR